MYKFELGQPSLIGINMSSTPMASRTYRAFRGRRRLATGVLLKNGSFLQVHPTKRHYVNLKAWHDSFQADEIRFDGAEEKAYEDLMQEPTNAAPDVYREKKRRSLQGYYELQQKTAHLLPTVPPPSTEELELEKKLEAMRVERIRSLYGPELWDRVQSTTKRNDLSRLSMLPQGAGDLLTHLAKYDFYVMDKEKGILRTGSVVLGVDNGKAIVFCA